MNSPASTTIPSVPRAVAASTPARSPLRLLERERVDDVRVDRRVRADRDPGAARRDLVADHVERPPGATAPVATMPPPSPASTSLRLDAARVAGTPTRPPRSMPRVEPDDDVVLDRAARRRRRRAAPRRRRRRSPVRRRGRSGAARRRAPTPESSIAEPPPSPSPYESTARSWRSARTALRSCTAAAAAAPLRIARLSTVSRDELRAR